MSLSCLGAPRGVVSDGSLGSGSVRYLGGKYSIPASAGLLKGANLFQSFSAFDLKAGETATFKLLPSVRNVLARVGGGASHIDGKISCDANLFLMNPKGLIFGPNASLDVSGAFSTTTADSLKLGNGGRFYAAPGNVDSLSAAPVSAFGFSSASAASVTFHGNRLSTQRGKAFSIVAGDVRLDGATVAAPSGRLTISSVGGPGEVPASRPLATLPKMGSITLRNQSSVNINGKGGGKVVIRGGRLSVVGGSAIESRNSGAIAGGEVEVGLTGSLYIHDGKIFSKTVGAGRGGDVSVESPRITVDGKGFTPRSGAESFNGIASIVGKNATSGGGDLNIRSNDLSLTAGGILAVTTRGQGGAGKLDVSADGRLTIDGSGSDEFTGIFSFVEGGKGNGGDLWIEGRTVSLRSQGRVFAATFDQGAAGDVHVRGETVSLSTGGVISSDTYSSGNAGNVDVSASIRLSLDSSVAGLFSSILSNVRGSGDGGNVVVHGGSIRLGGGASISADTYGSGNAGNVEVSTSGRLTLDGSGAATPTVIGSDVDNSSEGKGGDVNVRANTIFLLAGGEIRSTTFGRGESGKVEVAATGKLTLDGSGSDLVTGILSDVQSTAVGDGGDVVVHGGTILLRSSGVIAANTFGLGNAGKIDVTARDLLAIRGSGTDSITGIAASVQGSGIGDGGDVTVHSRTISIYSDGNIFADTLGRGDAGNVNVTATERLTIDGGGLRFGTGITCAVDRDAIGKGGDVRVRGGAIAVLGGGEISARTLGRGDAGNIEVTASDKLTIERSSISASVGRTGAGKGGDVIVRGGTISVRAGGDISVGTAGRGDAGKIEVVATRGVVIDGMRSSSETGLFALVEETATGNGGDVSVRGRTISLLSGGQINASSGGQGNAGKIDVRAADRLNIDRAGANPFTGIFSSMRFTGTGKGGDVLIRSGTISLLAGAEISASSAGAGDAGEIDVAARGKLSIVGESSRIASEIDFLGNGNGGDVTVHAGMISLRGGGSIDASTFGDGDAGKITVATPGKLAIDGFNLFVFTGISAQSLTMEDGAAGSIDITAGRLSLSNAGAVAVTSVASAGGDIQVNSASMILMRSGSSITASAAGGGGNIFLRAPDRILLDHSRIVGIAGDLVFDLPAGTQRSAKASLVANGGNMSTRDAAFLILNHSTVSANAAFGQGGNILLQAQNFFSSSSAITATGSTAGSVVISAPIFDLSGALVSLSAGFTDASTRLQERCAMRLGGDASSFLTVGRGGAAENPDELMPASSETFR